MSVREEDVSAAAELSAMQRLHELVGRLLPKADLTEALDDVLDAAIELTGADMGNLQLLDPERQVLHIVAHRGFDQPFLEYFRETEVESASACGRAISRGERTFIGDVQIDPDYEPLRPIAEEAGYRAVQSTPLRSRGGDLLGVLSTHFRQPHRCTPLQLRTLDMYALQAADLIERHRSEAALRDSLSRFASVVNQSTVGIVQADANGRFVFVNDPYCEITGRSREQLLGLRMQDLTHPDDLPRNLPLMEELSLTGQPFTIQKRYVRPDGSHVWVHNSVTPIFDAEKRVAGGTAVCVDITERVAMQEALAAEKAYAESIVETLHEPLVVLTPDLKVRSANPAFYDHFEVRSQDAEGQLIYELGNGQWDIPELRRLLEDVLPDSNVFIDYEVSHDFEDIGHRVMLLNARRLDHVQLILLGIRDITDRKRAEGELRHRAEQFETLVEQAPIGVYVVDGDFRIAQVNPVARPVFGDIPDLIDRDFDEVIHILWERPYADEVAQLFRHTLETGERHVTPERAEPRGDRGVIEYYSWRIDRIPLPDGRHGVVCYFSDISDQVRARQAIAESEAKYRTLFESIDQGFCTFDMIFDEKGNPVDYRFVEYNPAFERHTGLTDAIGRTIREMVPEHEQHWIEQYGRVAQTGVSIRVEDRAEGLGRWYEVYAFRIGEPEQRRVAALFSDVTAQKEAERALREWSETLEERVEARTREVRELAETLSIAEQEERQRLSQLLHDDLQQLLYGIQMKVSVALKKVEDEEVLQGIQQGRRSLELLDEAITRTRQLTVDLNPPILQGEGLVSSLEWLRTQMRDLHGLEVQIQALDDTKIHPDLRVLLFQITRELLFNVAKHADTDRAVVEVAEEQGVVRVAVADQGRGFDPTSLSPGQSRSGLGLFSARERLRMRGGDLEIESAPGAGARVVAYAPLDSFPDSSSGS